MEMEETLMSRAVAFQYYRTRYREESDNGHSCVMHVFAVCNFAMCPVYYNCASLACSQDSEGSPMLIIERLRLAFCNLRDKCFSTSGRGFIKDTVIFYKGNSYS